MAEMADYELISLAEYSYIADAYVSGELSLEDAYDMGFIDEYGTEQEGVQEAWDRNSIGTLENIDNEMRFLETHFKQGVNQPPKLNKEAKLDKEAIANLSKDRPTCNYCRESMSAQNGKYGKFYFCPNQCKEQKTVSDKYWQSCKNARRSK